MTPQPQSEFIEEEFKKLMDIEEMYPMSVVNWSIENWKKYCSDLLARYVRQIEGKAQGYDELCK